MVVIIQRFEPRIDLLALCITVRMDRTDMQLVTDSIDLLSRLRNLRAEEYISCE